MIDLLVPASRLVIKKGLPLYLIQFVTTRCNARCAFCFAIDGRNEEMTVDDFARFTPGLGRLLYLSITGGEPFLREDLGEIIDIYCRTNRPRILLIPTNGYFTDRVVRIARTAADRWPEISFEISVSIDAIGKEHDDLRRVNGMYDRAADTIKALQSLSATRANLHLMANLTIGDHNVATANDTVDHLFDKLAMQNVTLNIARSNRPRDLPDVDLSALGLIYRNVEDRIESRRGGFAHLKYGRLLNRFRRARRRYLFDLIGSKGASMLPCQAGQIAAVIGSRGDVFPCESWAKPIGNVLDPSTSFAQIWSSPEAEEARAEIKQTRCHCTHECFNHVNVMWSARGILGALAP